MPYKTGKLKGELTTPEIRKLIKAHNVLVSIKIPKGAKREDIMGILQKAGYSVNHEKQALVPYRYVSKGKGQKLKVISQKTIEKELPKPKTKLEKQKAKEEKEEKNIQKKKQERTERKSIVEKALKQQEKTISKKTKPKPKPKTSTISTQTEEPKKVSGDKIFKVFTDIMIGYDEVIREGIIQDNPDKEEKKDNNKIIAKSKKIKNIKQKIEERKSNFTVTEKKIIGAAIFAYVDLLDGDEDLEDEVKIAKILQKKYPYDTSYV
jgi:hypothetical protein